MAEPQVGVAEPRVELAPVDLPEGDYETIAGFGANLLNDDIRNSVSFTKDDLEFIKLEQKQQER